MKPTIRLFLPIVAAMLVTGTAAAAPDNGLFPDGTPIPEWFSQSRPTDINALGTVYKATDHGVKAGDSTLLQTAALQALIDKAAAEGGGVIRIPEGTYLTGALFFKPGTHLHLDEGATLKGSDDIADYPIIDARVEGQNLKYFAALINAIGVDGFTLSGKGTVNGNGERYWKSFWLRRRVIPNCTNMDEMRPRLLFISHSNDVQLSDVRLINSPFWTTHVYKCDNLRLLGLRIFAPSAPIPAPSSDAIDVDACRNVLIKGCSMSVSDDAIALKGGKGPWADTNPDNGANENVIIEDCFFGFCHSALTCGSESIHDRNIVMRRCKMDGAIKVLYLKMRPDTPQNYEYITVEQITGNARSFLEVGGWMQFFDLQGRPDKPLSYGSHVTFRDIDMECQVVFNIRPSDDYRLSDFTLRNVRLKASKDGELQKGVIENLVLDNVTVE
ncbi:MAG: exopolygalacturonase [Rikenellaceae bacterium]|nr:exopolygalacturonase [Rikenellaceae bacterium]